MARRKVETSGNVETSKRRNVETTGASDRATKRRSGGTSVRGIKSTIDNRQSTIADFVAAMERIAPTSLAQEWDNVGLIAGDLRAPLRRVLLTIDLTADVVDEARRGKFDLVFAYHPPIFKPISALRLPSTETSGLVFECIRAGIAIYSSHTALDAADGGTNDVLAGLCGIKTTEPIEYVDASGPSRCKFVVFVPTEHLDKVADAVFLAGAGRIGDYTHCSYRLSGEGTFFGTDATNPAVGRRGRLERVAEVRLESIVDTADLPAVVVAMRRAHPYEEPAFDIYPLRPAPARGIGRIGTLPAATTLKALAKSLKAKTKAANVQIVGDAASKVDRAIIVAGSAGSLPFRIDLTPRDVIVTGEMRHHDALTVLRRGCSAITLGHWASERPVITSLTTRLGAVRPGLSCVASRADCDPFRETW